MPELPEVETVCRTLKSQIIGKRVESATLLYPRVIKSLNLSLNDLIGHKFTEIERIGKFIIFHLSEDYHMVLHLRMEGKIFYFEKMPPIIKAMSFYLSLDEGYLVFQDTRKFGVDYVFKGTDFYNEEPLVKVGKDPFNMDVDILYNLYSKENGFLKETLLNQTLMSGIGNIYADEILFASNLSPFISPKNLTYTDVNNILENAKKIMARSIELGGSTVKTYLSSANHAGSFQDELKVYSHEHEPCPICKTRLEKRPLGGRGTTFCRHCQKTGQIIGITGLIGTGKSTLTKVFVSHGYLLYDCDKKVAELYEDEQFIKSIKDKFAPIFDEEFSKEVVLKNLQENKIFRRKYETFVYQIISNDLINFLNHHSSNNIVVEAPRLFEAHLEKYMSYVIAVVAQSDTIYQRLLNRGAKNIDKLLELNKKSQIIDKMDKVDFIFENDFPIEEFSERADLFVKKIMEK